MDFDCQNHAFIDYPLSRNKAEHFEVCQTRTLYEIRQIRWDKATFKSETLIVITVFDIEVSLMNNVILADCGSARYIKNGIKTYVLILDINYQSTKLI